MQPKGNRDDVALAMISIHAPYKGCNRIGKFMEEEW